MKPLKIAFLITGFSGGGIETYILTLGRYFQSLGHQVTVICTLFKGAWFPRLAEAGLTAVTLDGLGLQDAYTCLMDLQAHFEQARYDVLLPNQEPLTMALLPWLDSLPEAPKVFPVAHMDIDYAYRLTVQNAPFATGLIGVSRQVSEQLAARLLFARHKVHTLLNPVPPSALALADAMPEEAHLLFVGRLHHEQKGVLFLPGILKAIEQQLLSQRPDLAERLTLTLIGDGPDRHALLEGFANLGLKDKITWGGMQATAQVQQAMAGAWVLLFPSQFEGLPLVLLEAQQAGLPVVAFDLPGITDDCLQANTTGWIVPQGDVQRFAQRAIETLCLNLRERLQIAQAARTHAQRFSVETVGQEYLSLIENPRIQNPLLDEPRMNAGCVASDLLPGAGELFELLFLHPQTEVRALSIRWAHMLQAKRPITRYLKHMGIKRVAVYGTAKLGHLLYYDCQYAGLDVLCFLDHNPEWEQQTCLGKPVFSPHDAITQGILTDVGMVLFSIEGPHSETVRSSFLKQCEESCTAESPATEDWKNLVFN